MAFLAIEREDGTISTSLAWICGLCVGINVIISMYLYLKNYRRVAFQALVMPLLYWPIYAGGTWGTYWIFLRPNEPAVESGALFLLIVPIALVMLFLSASISRRIFLAIPWPEVIRVRPN